MYKIFFAILAGGLLCSSCGVTKNTATNTKENDKTLTMYWGAN